MAVGIFVLGVDGRDQRRDRLLEQALGELLPLPELFHFLRLVLHDLPVAGPDQDNRDGRQQVDGHARDTGQRLAEKGVIKPERELDQQRAHGGDKARPAVIHHQADNAHIAEG